METRPPDWEYWGAQKSLRAWECLALSVGVEPRDLGVDHFLVLRSSETGSPLISEQDPAWLADMCQRLPVLLKTLEEPPSGLRAGRGKAVVFDAELKLHGFVDWARKRKWKLPKALRELVPPAADKKSGKARKARPKSAGKAAGSGKGKPASAKS